VLTELAAWLAPDARLEVGAAKLDSRGRLEMHRVLVQATDDGATILAARRVVVGFSPWTIASGHVDLLVLDEPLLTPRA